MSGNDQGQGESVRLHDPLHEALRLIASAHAAGLQLRLIGGLAFHAKAPTWTARIDREGRDIDLVTRSRDKRSITSLLISEGYVPDKGYNAIHGYKQLYFTDSESGRPVDVLIGRLEMCHRIDLAERLDDDYPTVPLAELLLSKLQIVKINRKDILDALVLLAEYPITDNDHDGINSRPIVDVCTADWGWWRTLTMNLEMLEQYYLNDLNPPDLDVGHPYACDPLTQIATIKDLVNGSRKSVKWGLRARIGDRITWYQLPEEVEHSAI